MNTQWNLFIGRWQPFHDGHKALIQKVLEEGKYVLIAMRDTPLDEKNPYTYEMRKKMILDSFPDEVIQGRVRVMLIPDIEAVCYGRNVGYDIRELHLDPELEAISGTAIREELRNNYGSNI